jgi:uracil-DNA glycosylase family 4
MNNKPKVKPFFENDEIQAVSMQMSQDTACFTCGLFKTCLKPKMKYTGEGRRKILIIAEAPGETEDETGIQLVGKSGQFFRNLLKEYGLDLDRDFWKTNSIICRPPNNRKPKRVELKLCKSNYMKLIEELKPKFIWLVGAAAIESFYMDKYSDDEGTDLTPTRWRGLCIPDKETKAWILPMFHPSYAMRNEKDDLTMSQYKRDLIFAINCLKREAPTFFNLKDHVKILKDFDEVCDLLEDLIENPPEYLVFDYEATGLKPFNKGHKIASISLCFDNEMAYSFPVDYPHFTALQAKQIKDKWKKVLEGPSFKIAHNVKFEDVWSIVILDILVNNWFHCTMNGAHILDNRRRFTGLKFQAFIRWGVEAYNKAIAPFLKDKQGNGFNTIMKANLNELLTYGACDSFLESRLLMEQLKEMTPKMRESMNFFLDGLLALSDMQINGIPTDRNYYEKTGKQLEEEITDSFKKLLASKEAVKFKKEVGRDISFTSDADLRKLFYEILKHKPPKTTDSGLLPSVDAEAIRALNSPIGNQLIHINKLDKIKGTYISQFLREINDDGKMHPFFNLHNVQTFRSSSEGPNFQNIPVRDADAKKYTRSGIYPSPGNLILDFDYGALEVRIICAVTGDKVLRSRLEDPHTEWAMHLFKLKKEQVTKDIRFYAKNMWVFAMFYGSWYRNCGESLWDTIHKLSLKTKEGVYLLDHLMGVGIINTKDKVAGLGRSMMSPSQDRQFLAHLRGVEKKFWSDFSGVKKWQEENWAFYKKHGYIDLVTGFRCSGYMSRNDLANYPIQGPAFHCLLWSVTNINEELKKRNLKTKIIGQIHDCCLFDCYPPEKEIIKNISMEIATKRIRREWNWLDVPLILEFEETGIDQSWYSKKEIREE